MAVPLQAGETTLTAMVVKGAFAKDRSETMTTEASSGYASEDSMDLDYETPCSASSPQSRNREQTFDSDKNKACFVSSSQSNTTSGSGSRLEKSQEISQIFNENSVPGSAGPKASVGLIIPGITKGHPRSIFTIDVPNQHTEAHTNMQIAAALTPVGSPTSSGRRTQAWRRQQAGCGKDASDPVHDLLKVARRRLFQLVPPPQTRDCIGTNSGFAGSQTSSTSFPPTMATTRVVAQPTSAQFDIQAITYEHMMARHCSHLIAQTPVDRFAYAVTQPPSTQLDIPSIPQHLSARHCSHVAPQNPVHEFARRLRTRRNSGIAQETAEPRGVPRHSRSVKHDVPMKIMSLSPANDGIAVPNPLEPVYKQVSSYLTEDTFGKALLQFRRELIAPPPGLGLQREEKACTKTHTRTRTASVHNDVFEDSRKNEV